MTTVLRSLPLRIGLRPGEAFDSWLIRLAHRNGAPVKRIASALGLEAQVRDWRHFAWIKGIRPERLRVIEHQAGLAAGSLDGAVLDRFEELRWLPVAGSRFCPACLHASGGVWPVRWQLPYSVACTDHRCLLMVACPECGLAPHLRINSRTGTLPSHHCASLPRRAADICRANLLDHFPPPLDGDDPRLEAQAWVDERLDRMDPHAVTDLRDLDILARWFRARVFPVDVEHLGPDTVRAIDDHRNPELHLPWRRPHPNSILVEAALAHLAVGILAAADSETRHRRFTPLFRDVGTAANTATASQAPRMLSRKRIIQLSLRRQQELLAACDRHLPVSERLRYYTATPEPRLTEPGASYASERARYLPQRLWQDWLVRFAPPKGFHTTAIAVDIPTALMLPGNPLRNTGATRELSPWRNSTSVSLAEIAASYPDVLQAVCNLADWIDANGGPVDYRRRRATFTDVDLPEHTWQELCARLKIAPGRGLKLQFVRLHLFGLLTGADILTAKTLPGNPDKQTRRTYSSFFKNRIPVRLRAALTEHAAGLLAAAGIEEPVTWSPPADCIAGLRLPGPDPASLSAADLTDCIERQRLSTTATATRLGTTIEHIRYLLEQRDPVSYKPKTRTVRPTPPRPAPKPAPKPRPRKPTIEPPRWSAAHILNQHFLEDRLVHQSKSTRQLAEETGFSIGTIRKYASRHGIRSTHRPAYTKKIDIDPDWFRYQTEILKRPNTEIAAELGIGGETLRKRRLELGIAANPPGIYHNRRFPDLPRDIRSAVEGQQDGWTRLYRFRQTMAFPSMNIAAQQLGYYTSNLNLQINRLENDIGAKLIERGHRYQPMKPTDRGQRLLNDLEQPEVRELLGRYAHQARIDKPNRRKRSDTTDAPSLSAHDEDSG